MADYEADAQQSWSELKICNILDPPWDRIKLLQRSGEEDCDLKPVRVSIGAVQNLSLGNTVPGGNKLCGFHVRLGLFDIAFHQFFGRTLVLPDVRIPSSTSDKVTVDVKQDVCFLTPLFGESGIVLYAEIVGLVNGPGTPTEKNSRGADRILVSLGWTVLKFIEKGSINEQNGRASRQVHLYHGSPRALLFLEDPIECNPLLQQITHGCGLSYAIDYPKRLVKIRNFLAPNVLIAADEPIPGLADAILLKGAREDSSRSGPRLQRSTPLVLNDVRIQLTPSLEAFEEEICKAINEEQQNRAGSVSSGAQANIVIAERRLRIGVHNGWSYMKPSQILHLGINYDRRRRHGENQKRLSYTTAGTRNLARTLSWSPSMQLTPGGERILSYDNKIMLAEMREDVDLAVLFSLEYMMATAEQASSAVKGPTGSILHPSTVIQCQAMWKPHLEIGNQSGDVVCLPLVGGPTCNPECLFVYRGRGSSAISQCCGKLRFRFSWIGDKKRAASLTNFGSRIVPRLPVTYDSQLQKSSNFGNVQQQGSASTLEAKNSQTPAVSFHEGQRNDLSVPNDNNGDNKYKDGGSFLVEVPSTAGPRLPIVALSTRSMLCTVPLSRATYARLYAAGLPPILDRHGRPPDIVDPTRPTPSFLASKEELDHLKCNVITLQFLAYTDTPTVDSPFAQPRTIFFAFQFYHYPPFVTERLLLRKSETDLFGDPGEGGTHLLQKMKADGKPKPGPVGFEVKYCVDPIVTSAYGNGASHSFGSTLNRTLLHVDVWDGDSLMFVGNTVVKLEDLCRQGKEAVQVTYELDVIFAPTVEDDDDDDNRVSASARNALKGASVKSVRRGRLHIRMANVGYPFRNVVPEDESLVRDSPVGPKLHVPAIVRSACSLTEDSKAKHKVSMAKSLLVEMENFGGKEDDVLEVIRTEDSFVRDGTIAKSVSEETARKLMRMVAVRSTRRFETNLALNVSTSKEHKLQTLKIVEMMRERAKAAAIMNNLNQWVGVHHTISPVLGSAEYLEFELINPLQTEQAVAIECGSSDLRVIVDSNEWQTFRKVNRQQLSHGNSIPIEESMFATDKHSGLPQILLKPREKVFIPFRYQSFDMECWNNDEVYDLCRSGLGVDVDSPKRNGRTSLALKNSYLSTKLIKVHFRGEDGKAFTVMCLTVQSMPPRVDQILRVQHSENSFLKRLVRFSRFGGMDDVAATDGGVVSTTCANPNVIVEVLSRATENTVDVLLKVPCSSSGSVSSFLLFVYGDVHRIRPIQTCKVTVQALQRIDLSCVMGQSTQHSIMLQGGHSTRLVKCFSSHPSELQLQPGGENPFVLAAYERRELCLSVKSLTDGKRFMYVHAVDVEFHVLLHCWMVCVRCRSPIVTRSFQIQLPTGGGLSSNKRISYRNPYPKRRIFCLSTDRPDLLKFRDSMFEVDADQCHIIGLIFPPCCKQGSQNILVFINSEEDINEETFCVKAAYT